jgi:hypothetical protein
MKNQNQRNNSPSAAPGLGTSSFKQVVMEYRKVIENARAQRPKLLVTTEA